MVWTVWTDLWGHLPPVSSGPDQGGESLKKDFFQVHTFLTVHTDSIVYWNIYMFSDIPVRTGKNPVPTVLSAGLKTRLVVRDAFVERVKVHLEDLC